MQLSEVMTALEAMGSEQTRRMWRNHGAPEPIYGVKIGDLKTLVKKIKVDQDLASQLYATGNGDAMYLAGLIADPQTIAREELGRWARRATWYMVSEYAVAGVAAESPFGWELGLEWIDDSSPRVASAGWATLAGVLSIRDDADLDLGAIHGLLDRVLGGLHEAPNRVRYTMNSFVIAVGCYVEPGSARAQEVAQALGKVNVHMGATSCKVPAAPQAIQKVVKMGRLGRKRRQVRC